MRSEFRGITCFVLALMTCVSTGCKEPLEKEKAVRPVQAVKVGDVSEINARSFPGRSQATEEVNLSFQVSGPLVEFPVKVGDKVITGQSLAKINSKDFQTELEKARGDVAKAQANLDAMKQGARPEELQQLKAEVKNAQAENDRALADFQRIEQLKKSNAIPEKEFDRSRQLAVKAHGDLRTAQEELSIGEIGAREEDIRAKEAEIRSLAAAVVLAEDQVNYADLKAPFDGVVSATYAENFEQVQAKQQILRLLNISQIEITLQIPEHLISKAEYLQDLQCTFDAFPDTVIDSVQVKEIGREASEVTRTYPVTLIMDQPDPSTGIRILPGMAGRVSGNAVVPDTAEQTGFVVPETAVFAGEGNQKFVWVIDESSGTVSRKPVTPGQLTEVGIRVSGLKTGWWVATAGVHYLTEGQTVRIQQPATGESE